MKCFLSVIIPAFNEENRIRPSLDAVVSFLKTRGYVFEIIVIDDGSVDETRTVISKLAQLNPEITVYSNRRNRGKGYSVKRGMLIARGDCAFFTDADLSTPIEEVDNFILAMEKGSDIVIGSRQLRGANIVKQQPIYRVFMGKIFNVILKILKLTSMLDTQCGAKIFKKAVRDKIFSEQRITGFAFDVEVLFLARKNGYLVKEIPVKWINSADSRVRAFFDSVKMLKDIIKIRVTS